MTKFSSSILLALSIWIISTAGALAQSANSSSGRIPGYADPSVPGATGSTVVRGNDSTITGDRAATIEQRYFQQSEGQEADRTGHPAKPSTAPAASERH
jgi:hypothetical protein